MVKATWRLSLLFGLTLLFCGYCILLGGLAGLTDACHDIPRRNPSQNVTFLQWCADIAVKIHDNNISTGVSVQHLLAQRARWRAGRRLL